MSQLTPVEVELEDGTIVTLTPDQVGFLAAFRVCGVISHASNAAGIHRGNHAKWMRGDCPGYHQAFAEAQADATDNLEAEARHRAMVGDKQYKFTKDGTPILRPGASLDDDDPYYYEHAKSDRLLELLLKANRPEKFKDRISQEISGAGGNAIEVTHAMRQMAVANPDLSEQLCTALENATGIGHDNPANLTPNGSHGDTSGLGMDD